tara:strand:+ start:3758 stop:4588 length:831 start_codon:yes stop_codon:yes gene_type:complete
MKKIFITGASSYLGRNVIEKFKDYEFIALINNKDVEYKNVKNLRIDSFNEIKDIFEEESFDYVFHFASQRHTQDDTNDIQAYVDINISLGIELLKASNNSKLKLFIYSGSLWQDLLKQPKNLYTISKEHFDDYLKYFSLHSSFNILSLRIGDQYGPDDFRNKIIPHIKTNENKETIEFNSNGDHLLSLVHIEDILNAIKTKISDENLPKYEILRLCSKPISIKEFIDTYKEVRGKTFNPLYGDLVNDSFSKEEFNQKVTENIWENNIEIKNGLKSL